MKINVYVYSDIEKEHILHIHPFSSILKGLLIQKIRACGGKSCGWDYSRINPLWFGVSHHTPGSSQTKNPNIWEWFWLFHERRLALTSQSHPPRQWCSGVFCSFRTTGGCLPPQAGRGGGEELTQYSIFFQCLMGVRMGANCDGSSNTHTDWQRVFLPRHSPWPAVSLE